MFGTHNHTDEGSNQRLRDSTNKVVDLINYYHKLGHSGLAITDHEALTAHKTALDYYNSVKSDSDWSEFKLALGNEIYLCEDNCTEENIGHNIYPHFILIALDAEGHKGLRELSSNAWRHNAFVHVMYRIPTYYDDLENMLEKYKGHVIGQSACLGGSLPKALLMFKATGNNDIWYSCIDWVNYMNEIFGEGYFFLELQPSHNEEQVYVNSKLVELSKITNTPYLISTDAHYLTKEDRPIHEAFLKADKEGDRETDEFYATTYVMSEDEIHKYMDKYLGYDVVQRGLDNTGLVYDKVQCYTLDRKLHIPLNPLNTDEPNKQLFDKYSNHIELLSKFYYSKYDSDRYMIRDVLTGIENNPQYQTDLGYFKINECLEYLDASSEKMEVRWSAYLEAVKDYVSLIWKANSLVGAGRGSGVGFCLLYLLGITQIDPIREKTQTFPWRFLNPYRASVLDIDLDTESNARERIIQKFIDTYGEERVCKVLTLSTEQSRSAILTAARGLGIDNALASYIASLIVFDRGQARSLKTMYYGNEDYPPVTEFVNEMNANPKLWETAQKIEGLVKGIGSHAGGVIITDEPITETAAILRTKSKDIVSQFDLHRLEDMSLIKIDLLCIDALDKIHCTIDLLTKNKMIPEHLSLREKYEYTIGVYNLERINPEMWKMLWEHKVLSFFQMEKASGVKAIALAKPHSVDDLATINSVIRLMAQEKGAESPLEKFARFHEDITQWYKEMDEYGLTQEEQDILKDIIGVSYGICEAQEYLVLLTQHPKIGGFSIAWGDKLRKAVANYFWRAELKNFV